MELTTNVCSKCGARWLNGQMFWSTGAQGNELDLAGLVCNNLKPGEEVECINSKRGEVGGDTWDFRRGFAEGLMTEWERANKNQKPGQG